MTPEEKEVLDTLGVAFTMFVDLPVLHPADQKEFCAAIHAAQNIVLSRMAMRELNKEDRVITEKP